MSKRQKLDKLTTDEFYGAIISIFLLAFSIITIIVLLKEANLPREDTPITYTVIKRECQHHAVFYYDKTTKSNQIHNYDDYIIEVKCNEDNHKEIFYSNYLYNHYREGDIFKGVISITYNKDGTVRRKEYRYEVFPE